MAIERFRRSNVSLISQIPTIDPVAAREAARTGQSFSQAMDRVANFAFRQGQQQAQERAETEGAQMVEELGARNAVAQIAERGGPQDLTEEVAFELASRIGAAEVETEARSEISQILTDAEINRTSFEEFQAQVDDVVLGYSAALEEFDPAQAVIARQRLEEVAATNLNRYAETWQKGQAQDVLARSIAGVEQRRRDAIAAGIEDSAVSQEETQKRLDDLEQYMRDNMWDEEAIQKTLLDAREDITKERIFYQFRNIDSIEEKRAYIEDLRENPPELLGEIGTRTVARSLNADFNSEISQRNSRSSRLSSRIDDEILGVLRAGGDPGEEKVVNFLQKAQESGDQELIQEAERAAVLRDDMLALRNMPPRALEAMINEERSAGIDNPYEATVIEEAERLLTNINSRAEKDPLSLGAEIGLIEFQPISQGDDVTESINKRIEDAELIADHFGVQPKYLTAAEAAEIGNQIAGMNPLEKANLAMGMNALPAGVWSQIAENNQGTFAAVAAIGDLNIGLAVFEGEALMRDKLVDMPDREELRELVNEEIGDVYGEKDRQAMIAASKAYYAYAATDRNSFDEDEFKQAIQTVTGGIAEVNGMKVQLPRQVDEDTFDRLINTFTPEMVEMFGGVQNLSNEEAAEAIREMQLMNVADNEYVVLQGQSMSLMDKEGNPFRIKVDDRLLSMIPGPGRTTRAEVRRGETAGTPEDMPTDNGIVTRGMRRQEVAP